MSGSFKLSLELDNDAMKEPSHVAAALHEVATALNDLPADRESAKGNILDDNGNLVGKWTYENEREEDDDDD